MNLDILLENFHARVFGPLSTAEVLEEVTAVLLLLAHPGFLLQHYLQITLILEIWDMRQLTMASQHINKTKQNMVTIVKPW